MERLSSSLRDAVFVVKSGPTHHFLSLQLLPGRGLPTTSTLDHVQGPLEVLGTQYSWAQDQRIGGSPVLLFGGSRG